MRRFILHAIVAALAFLVGVTATAVLGGVLGLTDDAQERRFQMRTIERTRHADPPTRLYDCPYSKSEKREFSALSAPPNAPASPETAKPSDDGRIRVRSADETRRTAEREGVEVEKRRLEKY